MTGSSPMSVQAKGKPEAIAATTTQNPKAIIPAEIKNESTAMVHIVSRHVPSEEVEDSSRWFSDLSEGLSVLWISSFLRRFPVRLR